MTDSANAETKIKEKMKDEMVELDCEFPLKISNETIMKNMALLSAMIDITIEKDVIDKKQLFHGLLVL